MEKRTSALGRQKKKTKISINKKDYISRKAAFEATKLNPYIKGDSPRSTQPKGEKKKEGTSA